MIKYNVYTASFELRGDLRKQGLTSEELWSWYQEQTSHAPSLVGSFGALDEAQTELQTYHPRTSADKLGGLWYVTGDLAYIEEEEWDEKAEEYTDTICVWDYAVAALDPDPRYLKPSVCHEHPGLVRVEWNDTAHSFALTREELDIYSQHPADAEPYETQDEAEEAFVEDVRNELGEAFPNLAGYFSRDEIDDLVTDITWRALSIINDSWAE